MIPAPTPVTPMATAIRNPRMISIPLLARNVDAALQLMPAPAARPRILRILRRRRTWRASDAGVTSFVQRKHRNVAPLQIAPHFRIGPGCQRAYLQQLLTARQTE